MTITKVNFFAGDRDVNGQYKRLTTGGSNYGEIKSSGNAWQGTVQRVTAYNSITWDKKTWFSWSK